MGNASQLVHMCCMVFVGPGTSSALGTCSEGPLACVLMQAGLTAAFRAGLSEVIPPAWTAMFAPGELQTLLSGAGANLSPDGHDQTQGVLHCYCAPRAQFCTAGRLGHW